LGGNKEGNDLEYITDESELSYSNSQRSIIFIA
jgi:hypothetical protein